MIVITCRSAELFSTLRHNSKTKHSDTAHSDCNHPV